MITLIVPFSYLITASLITSSLITSPLLLYNLFYFLVTSSQRFRDVFQETLLGPETIDPDIDFASDYPDAKK